MITQSIIAELTQDCQVEDYQIDNLSHRGYFENDMLQPVEHEQNQCGQFGI